MRDEVTFIVDMAKARTLAALGRNEEGWDLAAGAYKQRYPECPE